MVFPLAYGTRIALPSPSVLCEALGEKQFLPSLLVLPIVPVVPIT